MVTENVSHGESGEKKNPKSNAPRIEVRLGNHNGLSHLRFSAMDINNSEVVMLLAMQLLFRS